MDWIKNKLWNISKFNACISLQLKRSNLIDNGKAYLEEVDPLFKKALESLPEQPANNTCALTEKNAYLHIQGHQLYKLILHIGTSLCKGTGIAYKTDILDKQLHADGYEEIEYLQKDLKHILSR